MLLLLIYSLLATALGLQLFALWQQTLGLSGHEINRAALRRGSNARFFSAAALAALCVVQVLSSMGVLDPVSPGVSMASIVICGAVVSVVAVDIVQRRVRGRRHVDQRRKARHAAAGRGGPGQITYGEWLEQFRSLADQVGVIARCSSQPALVQIGHHTDKLSKHLKATAHRWASEEFPCDPEDAKDINSQIATIAALQFLLLSSMKESMDSAVADDSAAQLEADWSESLLTLVEELEGLGEQFLVEVGRTDS